MPIRFEERFFDLKVPDEMKEKIAEYINEHFNGNYDELILDIMDEDAFSDMPKQLIDIANNYRQYSQIIDKASISKITQAKMVDGKLTETSTVGITFGVDVVEPDDFIGILSIYF